MCSAIAVPAPDEESSNINMGSEASDTLTCDAEPYCRVASAVMPDLELKGDDRHARKPGNGGKGSLVNNKEEPLAWCIVRSYGTSVCALLVLL